MKKDTLLAGVVIVVLVLLGYFVFSGESASNDTTVSTTQVEVEGAQMLEAYVASLEAVNVLIDIPVATFVTVHESIGGAPGPIIAQSGYLESGKRMTSMAARPLLTSGTTYIVLVHKDDGDTYFDIAKDLPITSGGNVLRADVVAP